MFTDENDAIRPLLRHLMEEHGLKRIAFLAGYPGHPDSEQRLQAYREEMTGHGLEVDEEKYPLKAYLQLPAAKDAEQALILWIINQLKTTR